MLYSVGMEITKNIKGLTAEDRERVLSEKEYEVEIDGRTITVQAVNEYAARRKARALTEREESA